MKITRVLGFTEEELATLVAALKDVLGRLE